MNKEVSLGNLIIPIIKPVKGIDYFTVNDVQQIISQIYDLVNPPLQTAEIIRQNNEDTRQSNETTRMSNEVERENIKVQMQELIDLVQSKLDNGDFVGEQGVSITSVVVNGNYTLTVTLSDGTSYTSGSIRGEKGDTGNPGYTPVRGTDYWTNEDKQEIIQQVKEDMFATLNSKVDKIEGKGLSTNDYTNEEKEKLEQLENYDDTEIKEEQIEQNEAIEQLQKENEELKKEVARQRANQLKGQGEGESIYVEDSADDVVEELAIQGNSKQNTTEGRNYLPKLQVKSETKNGVTATSYDDGTITVKGTPTNTTSVGFAFSETTYNTNFYLHLRNNKKIDNWAISLREGNTNKFAPPLGVANRISQIPEEILINNFVILCNSAAIGTEIDLTLQPSIELTSQETEYEKFTYGASPNPDYEQPIHSCGDNINEFDKDTVVNGYLNTAGEVVNSSNFRVSDFIDIKNWTDLTISGSNGSSEVCAFYDSNKDFISAVGLGTNKTKTIAVVSNARYFRATVHKDAINTVKIEKGTKATPYSPYGMGCITEKIQNANYTNIEEILNQNAENITKNADGSITFTPKSSSYNTGYSIKISVPSKYSYKIKNGTGVNFRLRFVYEDGTVTDGQGNGTGSAEVSINNQPSVIHGDIVEIRFNWSTKGTFTIREFMFNKGTTALPYIPHAEQNYVIPTQQPMRSNNDVRDLFVKENGNWIERHLIREYEPNNDLAANGMTDERIVLLTPTLNIEENLSVSALAQKIKCNILQSTIVDNSGLNGTNADSRIRVVLSKNYATTYDEARAFFATNGLKIQYVTTEPLDLPCTEEQIAVLEEISKAETYKGGTVVMSEDEVPSYVDMTYIKDLQTYLDNRFNELSSAIVAQGGV